MTKSCFHTHILKRYTVFTRLSSRSRRAFRYRFPQPAEVAEADGAVVEAVAGHGDFAPDVSAVVGADGAVEAGVVEGLHHRVHVQRAVAGKVGGFLKIAGRVVLDVADVGKADAPLEAADNVGDVVGGVAAQAAGAEGYAVAGVVYHADEPQQLLLVSHNTGKAEHRPRGIVGVNRHVDAVLFAGGHNRTQEIFEVGEQRFFVGLLI